MRSEIINVSKVMELGPGKYDILLEASKQIVLCAVGAGGGGGAGLSDDPGDESTDGAQGQDTTIEAYAQKELIVALQSEGGVPGLTAVKGRGATDGGSSEPEWVSITTNGKDVQLLIIVGHGGRGGFVTGNKTAYDGTNGQHGRALVIAID